MTIHVFSSAIILAIYSYYLIKGELVHQSKSDDIHRNDGHTPIELNKSCLTRILSDLGSLTLQAKNRMAHDCKQPRWRRPYVWLHTKTNRCIHPNSTLSYLTVKLVCPVYSQTLKALACGDIPVNPSPRSVKNPCIICGKGVW